jgi:uncharacterized protein with ATP-grasp and redox domains
MKASIDCIPCFVRQSLDAVRLISSDKILHIQFLKELMLWMSEMNMDQSAPVLGQRIHQRLRQISGNSDPYREIKDKQNNFALSQMADLKKMLHADTDPFIFSMRLAIAGNVIDLGAQNSLSDDLISQSLFQALSKPITGDVENFRQAVAQAESILYLADNAGEIVFDRLFIEQLPLAKLTVAVRGGPVINDATIADAENIGLTKIVKVIENGSDAPGTVLEDCSPQFLDYFNTADLIIAKGQGNFETLSDVSRNIYFLFKVKCNVIANHIKQPMGTHILANFHTPRIKIN